MGRENEPVPLRLDFGTEVESSTIGSLNCTNPLKFNCVCVVAVCVDYLSLNFCTFEAVTKYYFFFGQKKNFFFC